VNGAGYFFFYHERDENSRKQKWDGYCFLCCFENFVVHRGFVSEPFMNRIVEWALWGVLAIAAQPIHAFDMDNIFGGGVSDAVAEEQVSAPLPEQWKFSRSEAHRQWVLKCVKGQNSGREKCNLIHQINNKQGQQILKIEILRSAAKPEQKQVLFHLPLGTYLPAGAVLRVGEIEEKMAILTCLPAGCQARMGIGVNLHQAFTKAEKGVVQLLNQNRQQKINIEFSLLGYSKGVEGVL